MAEEDADHYARSPVEIPLHDALHLAKLARNQEAAASGHSPESQVVARSSILSGAIAVEAAANCCVERGLGLPGSSSKAIREKLGTIEKFEIYLLRLGRPHLDRGHRFVQSITELLGVRNRYVHPAEGRQPVEVKQLDGGGHVITPDFGEPTKFLKLPARPHYWKPEHAESTVIAVLGFLDHVLIDCGGLDTNRASDLLCDQLSKNGSRTTTGGLLYECAFVARDTFGVAPRVFNWMYEEMGRRGVQFRADKRR